MAAQLNLTRQDNVYNQYLCAVKDLSSQLTLQPGLPAAYGGYSDVYIGTLDESGDATTKVSFDQFESGTQSLVQIAVKVFRVTEKRNVERALKALKVGAKSRLLRCLWLL